MAPPTAPRVVVLGLGKQADFSYDNIRDLSANLVRALRKPGIGSVATLAHGAGIGGLEPRLCARAIAEGSILGAYRFTQFKSANGNGDNAGPETVTIYEHDASKTGPLEDGAREGPSWPKAPTSHATSRTPPRTI
ncbi:MAG: M17 family peptidase N-terminal domain-containing protein [Dehalococcoidia bacterium]|nr:M17 family peptidase N-terminal domain-containing protein [Dehalococcoidia bacterium]